MDVFSLVGKITVNYAEAVNDLDKVSNSAKKAGESLGTMDQKAEEAGGSVEEAGESSEKANDGFTIWKGTLANLAGTAITKVISGCAQLVGKLGEVTQAAVGHYAEYEQLVGGVETLFKGSSNKLIAYAEKAYKTAGMSSNQYMDTATSFAASLIQGLGGDTERAVELTDQAIVDMSDNANKMGTDIGSIQDAYQGFAKQNYTMLDNLKLGYGGTQEEMIRLINDSGILGEKITSLDGITFDQMIEAIHKIQQNLGITGTTAEEAGSTISGSWGSIKALFENILTKVASKLAPTIMGFLKQLSGWMESMNWDSFADKVGNALQKVFDWIAKIDFTEFFEKGMDAMEKFLGKLGGFITDIPKIIREFKKWAPLIAGVTAAFLALKTALNVIMVIKTIPAAITACKTAILAVNAAMVANPILLIVTLIAGLVVALVTLWNTNEGFRNAVISVWNAIKGAFGTAIEAIKGFFLGLASTAVSVWETIKSGASTVVSAVSGFFTGLVTTLTNVWNTIKNVIQVALLLIAGVIGACFTIITLPFQFIWENCKTYVISAWNTIKNAVSNALNRISTTISNVWNTISAFLLPILNVIKTRIINSWNNVKSRLTTILNLIKNVVTKVWTTIKTKITTIVNNIKTAITTRFNQIKTVVTTVMNGVKSIITKIWNTIKSTVTRTVNGIKNAVSTGMNAVKNAVSKPLNAVKGKFTSVFESAKNIVQNAINKIKSYFHFSWSLPKLKLPHFGVSGKFSINPPSVPHFNVKWYKKAMEDPYMFRSATLFDVNPANGTAKGAGEAGDEIMYGHSNLMNDIQNAVGQQNDQLVNILAKILDAILSVDDNMGGHLREALEGTSLEVNKREFARLVKAVN